MYGFRCFYCLSSLSKEWFDATATIDHVLPIAKSGGMRNNNAVACCSTCNFLKGSDFTQHHVNLLNARDYLWNYLDEFSKQRQHERAQDRSLLGEAGLAVCPSQQVKVRPVHRLLQSIRRLCRKPYKRQGEVGTGQDEPNATPCIQSVPSLVYEVQEALQRRAVDMEGPREGTENHTAMSYAFAQALKK